MKDPVTGNYWSGPNKETKHEEISAEEALKRAGLSLEDVADPFSRSYNPQPACCECGSYVEPDGHCPHGRPSILLKKGLI